MLKICVFFSGGASSLKYLLENDPQLGKDYQIVGAFSNNWLASGINTVIHAHIPLEVLDSTFFLKKQGLISFTPEARRDYFTQISHRIQKWNPDLIMLSGFMLIITDPLLEKYYMRIINVHPADLRIVDEQGRRKYIGMNAVEEAIKAGEKELYSTIHYVTEEVDGGPIICISDPLKVQPGLSAREHQELMKNLCDGPAYTKALKIITANHQGGQRKSDGSEVKAPPQLNPLCWSPHFYLGR